MTLGSDGQIVSDAVTDTERIAELERRLNELEIELSEFKSSISPTSFRDGYN